MSKAAGLLMAITASRPRRKPVPEASTRRLDCPSGYVGAGEYQSRTVTWIVDQQRWDYGPWVTYNFSCILQPSYMEAYIPGDGAKYGTFSGSMPRLGGMISPVVSPSFSATRGGYTANMDMGIRGKNVTDDMCRAFGLNPERIVYVNNGDFIHYQLHPYVNHNYGGGFVTFNALTGAGQYTEHYSGKAETVGGSATCHKSYIKGVTLSNNGTVVSTPNIIGDYEISLAGFNGSMVCSGTLFTFEILRNSLQRFSGTRAVQRVDIETPLKASGGATRWFNGPDGIQFRPEGNETVDDYGGKSYHGKSLQISIPARGILVMYDTNQHTRSEPSITGSIALSPRRAFNRGMGETSDIVSGALAIPVNPGIITIGPNWCPYDSRTNGYMGYDHYFGWARI